MEQLVEISRWPAWLKKKTSYTRTDPFSRIHLLFESWFQGNIKKQQQTDEPSGCNFANLRTPSDTLHN